MTPDDVTQVIPHKVFFKVDTAKGYWSFLLHMADNWQMVSIVCTGSNGHSEQDRLIAATEALAYVSLHTIPTYGLQVVAPTA